MLLETLFIGLYLLCFFISPFPKKAELLSTDIFLHGVQSEYLLCDTLMCIMSSVLSLTEVSVDVTWSKWKII